MHRQRLARGARPLEHGDHRRGRDAAATVGLLDRPAGLEHRLPALVAVPVADDSDALGVLGDHDAELAAGAVAPQAQVTLVASHDLVVGLDAAELVHELGGVRPAQQIEVVGGPRAELHVSHGFIEPRATDARLRGFSPQRAQRSASVASTSARTCARRALRSVIDSGPTRPWWACVRRSVRSC